MRFYTFISNIVGASAYSLFNPHCPRRSDTGPRPPPPPTGEASTAHPATQSPYPVDATTTASGAQPAAAMTTSPGDGGATDNLQPDHAENHPASLAGANHAEFNNVVPTRKKQRGVRR
ncbi:hypothetical protein FOL46_006469 [Perkinsus olseni]|uniref:Uncharacterized protein n=1 Tax=Perkinsus olseni TaxID=32597 RepID=A0A7J6MQ93_PEROL|nr:hypothetical protein FOL46_006469 [Perkinsus olseni]